MQRMIPRLTPSGKQLVSYSMIRLAMRFVIGRAILGAEFSLAATL
jgi:hypothetical protein